MQGSTCHSSLSLRDLARLVRFFAQVYPQAAFDPRFSERYYAWKYFCEDHCRDAGGPTVLAVERGQEIAAVLGLLPFRLVAGPASLPSAWICDWHVLPGFRGEGLGRLLLETALEQFPGLCCLNGTEDAARLFTHYGFHCQWNSDNWTSVIRPLAYECPRRPAYKLPISCLAALARIRPRRTHVKAPVIALNEVDLREIPVKLLGNSKPGMARTGTLLQWFSRSPAACISAYLVQHSTEVAGYVLLHRDQDRLGRERARILDYRILSDSTEARCVVWSAIHKWISQHDRPTYIDLLSADDSPALTLAGFKKRSPVRLWYHTSGLPPAGLDAGWHLSFLDKDDAFRGTAYVA